MHVHLLMGITRRLRNYRNKVHKGKKWSPVAKWRSEIGAEAASVGEKVENGHQGHVRRLMRLALHRQVALSSFKYRCPLCPVGPTIFHPQSTCSFDQICVFKL